MLSLKNVLNTNVKTLLLLESNTKTKVKFAERVLFIIFLLFEGGLSYAKNKFSKFF